MNLDSALVHSILTGGPSALEYALSNGIILDRIHGESRDALQFALEYNQMFGKLPHPDVVLGKKGIALDPSDEPLSFLVSEIKNRHLHSQIQRGLKLVLDRQEARDPHGAYAELEKLLGEVRNSAAASSNVESLFKLGPDILAYYERIKNGETGILTPWPAINDITLGFWPEDLILFVARIGVGKTWSAVILAHHIWSTPIVEHGVKRNAKVLFITTEVSRLRIGMRFLAVHRKLPYFAFTHGRLSSFNEEELKKSVDALLQADGMYVIGGDFDFAIESVMSAIESVKPDIVILDGVYLLRVGGHNRNERMANAFDEMKRMAKRKKVPIVITTQFNREVKKEITKTVQVESIALSDVGGWNADLIFGLVQTEDMKKVKEMEIKPLKVREGAGQDVKVRWDFEKMDFKELNGQGTGGGDAAEFLTGAPDDKDIPSDDVPF